MKKSLLTHNEVLEYIQKNEPVTYRDIQNNFNVDLSAIFNIVVSLRNKELLQESDGKAGIKSIGYESRPQLQTRLNFQIFYNKQLVEMVKGLREELRICQEDMKSEPV